MKIIKFLDFINEELNDTPESYVAIALAQLKKKIDKMFEFQELDSDEEGGEQFKTMSLSTGEEKKKSKEKTPEKAKEESKKKGEMTFKDLGVRLESSEISKYSKLYDSLTVKFSDDSALYNLLITIDLKDALPTDATKDYSYEDIKKCYIKFKKYDLDTFEVLGQITKNTEIKKINEDFLVELKIEIDEKFGEEEEFQIETE